MVLMKFMKFKTSVPKKMYAQLANAMNTKRNVQKNANMYLQP